jgi:malonyl-CoA decarboxylase
VSAPLPTELLRRRAELLALAAPTDVQRGELGEVTEALRAALVAPATVRRLDLDDPDGAATARRLAAVEPVNPVRDETDLRDRFDADRRVFVLEHPLLPAHPMNVVWVSLHAGIPSRLAQVLDPGAPCLDPARADTAVFYSIWNADPGLAGLGRGVDLLDGAVELLRAAVPGFRRVAGREGAADGTEPPTELARRCARYLIGVRDGRLLDPVARFHMGNGARLLRVLPGADPSPQGMERSWGVMANYRYAPEDRAANRAALAAGRPAIGDEVAALLDR